MTRTSSDPSATAARPGFSVGMACVDTSGNPRIPMLMELVGALSRAIDPTEVLRVFSRGMGQIYGQRGYVSLSTRGLAPGEYRITRLLPELDPELLAEHDVWQNPGAIPVHTGGFLGELIRSAYPEIIHHLKLLDDPVVGDALADFRSLMAVPLFDNGEPLNWAVMLSQDPEAFTVTDLEESILRSNLVGGTVRNTVIAKKLREANRAIEREVDQIAKIQRALLPASMPEIAGVRLAASYETFDQAGGDYYDFLPLRRRETDGEPDPKGPWMLIVADASGHGPSAAVVMAMLQSLLHAYPCIELGPADVLDHVNRHLCAKRLESSFVTAFVAIYDPVSRRLRYARAGHNPPVVKDPGSGGAMRRLEDVGGVPLGILPDVRYEEHEDTLAPKQSLVLYTDGITEAMDPDQHMFGLDGIERALHECSGEPGCVVDSITTALRHHESSVRPNDDQTIVVMRVDG
jgi:sigma-B regulation protein RsbU (phosphoserine phosphatase)